MVRIGRGADLVGVDVDAARFGVGGFTVMLDCMLLELDTELTRLSSLVIVTRA